MSTALSPYSQEYAREAQAVKFYLSVWETFEFQIGECLFQIEVQADVTRRGEHGDLSLDSVVYKDIRVGLNQFGNPLKLDEQNLREDHAIYWMQIEGDVDLLILKHASKSQKWSAV